MLLYIIYFFPSDINIMVVSSFAFLQIVSDKYFTGLKKKHSINVVNCLYTCVYFT